MSIAALGCFGPDPREVEGAIAKAAEAIADGEPRELYKVIDERARHALISIVGDRREAAEVIRRNYPEDEQAAALATLGDAARVKDAAALFAMRCGPTCRSSLARALGAPRSLTRDGRLVHVVTTRDGQLELFHGSDTWYGLVWHTEALFRERDRAAAELEQVKKNAALYARRRAMQ